MNEFLLKVEDTFQIKNLGLILVPTLPLSKELPKTALVVLKKPDKTILNAECAFTVPHFYFSDPEKRVEPSFTCVLKDVEKESVPIGTEVWLEQSELNY